jgi:hypothetical protein
MFVFLLDPYSTILCFCEEKKAIDSVYFRVRDNASLDDVAIITKQPIGFGRRYSCVWKTMMTLLPAWQPKASLGAGSITVLCLEHLK